jgi:hypothetical protein
MMRGIAWTALDIACLVAGALAVTHFTGADANETWIASGVMLALYRLNRSMEH